MMCAAIASHATKVGEVYADFYNCYEDYFSGELVVVAPVAAGAFKHGLRAVSILIGSDMPETY